MTISVLEHFRIRKDLPIVQFLTWYLLLVEQWNFDDVADFEIEMRSEKSFLHETVTVHYCRFTFKDAHISTLKVVEHNDKMYVDHTTSYYPPDDKVNDERS